MRVHVMNKEMEENKDTDALDRTTTHSNNVCTTGQQDIKGIITMDDLRPTIHSYLTKMVHGEWANLKFSDVNMERLNGGLSNHLYVFSVPPESDIQDGDPRAVLVRIFGDSLNQEDQSVDNLVFALLAEKGLGPKLYGTFPGGRIEEYIPSVSLTGDDLRVPAVSQGIAEQLAWFHSLEMPVSKEPNTVYNHILRYEKEMREPKPDLDMDSAMGRELQEYMNRDFLKELDWLMETLNKISSPVVFCHNDLQAGNILKFGGNGDTVQLKLIDFEFSGYGYRSFDIANYFCEWSFDNCYPQHPYFQYNPEKYPSREEQILFLKAYQAALPNSDKTSEEAFLKEMEYFTLLSHFFCTQWAAALVGVSKIEFDYMAYANCRLKLYLELKAKLMNEAE